MPAARRKLPTVEELEAQIRAESGPDFEGLTLTRREADALHTAVQEVFYRLQCEVQERLNKSLPKRQKYPAAKARKWEKEIRAYHEQVNQGARALVEAAEADGVYLGGYYEEGGRKRLYGEPLTVLSGGLYVDPDGARRKAQREHDQASWKACEELDRRQQALHEAIRLAQIPPAIRKSIPTVDDVLEG